MKEIRQKRKKYEGNKETASGRKLKRFVPL
jgi:hypothetical protein